MINLINEKTKIQDRQINITDTILDALKQMDKHGIKLLFAFNAEKFYGLLSIGDIQRALIKKISLETPIKQILRSNITYMKESDSFDEIKKIMFQKRTECMPIIDKKGDLIKVYFWDEVFSTEQEINDKLLDLPVIIMAGGKGERLKPLTNIIPKPLIPIGEKTIIETIMDKFIKVGCKSFFLSVNYKSDFIKQYFDLLDNKYSIQYFEETKPLGTIGSVYLMKNKINKTFFVSNCDIIIDQDLCDVYDYHVNNKNDLTIVAALKHYKIPYGVIETEEDGIMTKLSEKPEITYMINTGVYLLEPHLINYIPENNFFHITQLIEKIKEKNYRIGVFPVTETSWIDIGEWKEYLSILKS
jgi:dTDP-glucose pyrophosphorylase/predicted transcriptional regulator